MDEEKRDSDDRQTDWLAALHFGGIETLETANFDRRGKQAEMRSPNRKWQKTS